jgi:hypothetical protein
MNQQFINELQGDDNRIGENNPIMGTEVLGSNQRKIRIKSRSMDRSQSKKLNKLRKKVEDDDFGGSNTILSDSYSGSGTNEYRFYTADPITNFILLLKRAGADKIITYFLLDMLLKKGVNKRTG